MKKNIKTPTILRKKRRHGFLKRSATPSGRKVIARRRKKGRKKLAA